MTKFALFAALVLGLSAPVQAAFAPPLPSNPAIELVRDGCGLGGHRDFRGFCVPNGFRPGYRICPVYFHPTPYGCRRNGF